LRHGINANLVRKWIPAYRDCQLSTLPALVAVKLASTAQPDPQICYQHRDPFLSANTLREMAIFRCQWLRLLYPRACPVIRIDAIWLATEPMDMRAGTDHRARQSGCRVRWGKAALRLSFCNRMKVSAVHDGVGIWLAARRLNQGRFSGPVSIEIWW